MTGMEELEQFTRKMERLKDARRSRKVNLTIYPFRMGTDKEAALKPLEEAAEAYASWQEVDGCGAPEQCSERCEVLEVCDVRVEFADEIADCIQACVNLADRYGIDLAAAMKRCEERNLRRGRYGANPR